MPDRQRNARRSGRAPARNTSSGRARLRDIQERRKTVMERFAAGADYRTIAREVGCAISTVHADVEAVRREALPIPELETIRAAAIHSAMAVMAAHVPYARMDADLTVAVVDKEGEIHELPVSPVVSATSARAVFGAMDQLYRWSGADKAPPERPDPQTMNRSDVDQALVELMGILDERAGGTGKK